MKIRVDKKSDTPVYLQIRREIRRLILTGQAKAGDEVGSVRGLSADLGINNSTAAKAYQMLTDDGVLEGRIGYGSFVTAKAGAIVRREEEERLRGLVMDVADSSSNLGITSIELRRMIEQSRRKRVS